MARDGDDQRVEFALSRRERTVLKQLLARTTDARRRRRAEALLWLDEGESVTSLAHRLRVSRQTIYPWAAHFQQRDGSPAERLADGVRSGRPATLAGTIDPLLDALIEQDPRDYGYAATVWTAPLLCRHLQQAHQITASEQSVRLAIDRLCVRWKRPRHQLSRRSPTWRQAKGGSSAA
jgi:transposase